MKQDPVKQNHGPTLTDLVSGPTRGAPYRVSDRRFAYVGSGKAAIALILGHLRDIGTIENKMGPILVPSWLGVQVYQTMLAFAVPTLRPTGAETVIMPYHQYGFPQDMDRVLDYAAEHKMVVIEDCAHAADSRYRGRQLGSLGDYAVFSFSKFTFCYMLGGIAHDSDAFADYLDRRLANGSRLLRRLLNGVKLVDEANLARSRPRLPDGFTRLRTAAYALYGDSPLPARGAIRLWQGRHEAEFAGRRAHYRYLRERVDRGGLCDHLEADDVTPWLIPLRMKTSAAERASNQLRAAGVEAGIYNFDMNRFLVEPKFEPCLTIPCHSAISDARFEQILEIIHAAG